MVFLLIVSHALGATPLVEPPGAASPASVMVAVGARFLRHRFFQPSLLFVVRLLWSG